MKRTYNEFVDNGLFVASYLLNKEIEDITEQDILDNKELFIDKLLEFISCESLSSIGTMLFFNSPLMNPTYKNEHKEKTLEFFNMLEETLIDDNKTTCFCCGEKRVSPLISKISTVSSSVNPLISAKTFYNFSNNLHIINICPICLILSMLSLLNTLKFGINYLIISDNDDFMKDYTKQTQYQNSIYIESDGTIKNNKKIFDFLYEIFDEDGYKDIYNCGYIGILRYNNSKGNNEIENLTINKKYIDLIKKLKKAKLYNEFKEKKLIQFILNNKLEYIYLNYLIDFNKQEFRCSYDLIDFLNKELNNLDNKIKELVIKICDKIYEIDSKNSIYALQGIKSCIDFQDLLLKYADKSDKALFDLEELELLTNHIKYKKIKNYMICQLLILRNKEKEGK